MNQEIVRVSPEGLEVANAYLTDPNLENVAAKLSLPVEVVSEVMERREVKKYIDNVYLDTGYLNRHKLSNLLSKIIDSKIEEADESGMWTKMDLGQLIKLAHQMRQDEQTSMDKEENIRTQTNIQINNNGYSKLLESLTDDD